MPFRNLPKAKKQKKTKMSDNYVSVGEEQIQTPNLLDARQNCSKIYETELSTRIRVSIPSASELDASVELSAYHQNSIWALS